MLYEVITWACRYHWSLIIGAGLLTLLLVALKAETPWPWLFLPAWWPLLRSAWRVQQSRDPGTLNLQLKRTAMGSLLFNLLLALGFALQ